MQVPGRRPSVWLIGNSRPVRLKIEQPWECKSPHADQFWNVHRTSEPGLGANEGVPSGKWCKSTAFHHSCARSSKRAGGLIPRIALDQCRVPERYRTRVPIFVSIAQFIERARPKRQVVGESPAGDTSFCGCGSTAECGRAKAETTVRFRSPAPF